MLSMTMLHSKAGAVAVPSNTVLLNLELANLVTIFLKVLSACRRCCVAVLPMAFGPEADSSPRFDSPLVQGASCDVVNRLRPNTLSDQGTCPKWRSSKKNVGFVVVFLPPTFCVDGPAVGRVLYSQLVVDHIDYGTSNRNVHWSFEFQTSHSGKPDGVLDHSLCCKLFNWSPILRHSAPKLRSSQFNTRRQRRQTEHIKTDFMS